MHFNFCCPAETNTFLQNFNVRLGERDFNVRLGERVSNFRLGERDFKVWLGERDFNVGYYVTRLCDLPRRLVRSQSKYFESSVCKYFRRKLKTNGASTIFSVGIANPSGIPYLSPYKSDKRFAPNIKLKEGGHLDLFNYYSCGEIISVHKNMNICMWVYFFKIAWPMR